MNNDQEWRQLILSKIDKIEGKVDKIDFEMNTLKVKVALFSSAIGSIATFLINKIF